MINCTVVKNEAEGQSGGAANTTGGAELQVRNCILWDNDDGDGGTDDLDAQLFYTDGTLLDENVDKNVIYQLSVDPNRFVVTGGQPEENKGDDPDVVNTTSGMTWLDCTYDAATGISTFNIIAEVTNFSNQRLFQPDGTSPLQLLITSVDEGADTISCYGNWTDLHSFETKTGTIFDYHIASGSSAIDYGAVGHLPNDVCDIDGANGTAEDLPWDLDENDRREQSSNPDSGVYEIE